MSITAIHIARLELREISSVNEIARARLAAESGIEYAICAIKKNALWRTTHTSGNTNTPLAAIGTLPETGSFTYSLIDMDGNLNDNNQDCVTIRSVGRAGKTTSVIQVMVHPRGAGLNCLGSAIHSAGQIIISSTLTSNQTVSANARIQTSGPGILQGSAWSTSTITGTVTGSRSENQTPPKAMPDPMSVFEYYTANGTPILFSSIPSAQIQNVVLTAGKNPFGTGTTNAEGIYVIDCQGLPLVIKNSRIEGTLVLLNAGDGTRVDNSISWKPAIPNFPALMVQGSIEFSWDRYVPLTESWQGVNFNPPGAPYNGVSDSDQSDSYPAVLEGLVYISDDLEIQKESAYSGVIIAQGMVALSKSSNFTYQSTYLNNAPPGFSAGTDMQIVPGTWKRVAY